jgi:ribosomal protein S16
MLPTKFQVSEEKIKMWKVNGRQTTDEWRQVMAKAHIAFGKVS